MYIVENSSNENKLVLTTKMQNYTYQSKLIFLQKHNFLKKLLFICYLKVRVIERGEEIQRALPHTGSFSKQLQWPKLGPAETSGLHLQPNFAHGWQVLNHFSHPPLLSQANGRKLGQQWITQYSNQCSYCMPFVTGSDLTHYTTILSQIQLLKIKYFSYFSDRDF